MLNAIDVSSYQSRDLTSLITQYTPDFVIIRLYLPDEIPPQEHSLAQISSAKANHIDIDGYVWAYNSLDPSYTIEQGLKLAKQGGLELKRLWVDCESSAFDPGPDIEWLRKARYTCEKNNVIMGIYTGGWYWRNKLNDSYEFLDLPLWLAQYDGRPDIENVTLFGGWRKAEGKQWSSNYVDQSVFRDREVGMDKTVIDYLNDIWRYLSDIQSVSNDPRVVRIAEDCKQKGVVGIKKVIGLQ